MTLTLSKSSNKLALYLFSSVTLMRLVIEYVYNTQISVFFKYSGYLDDFDISRSVISWLLMYSLLPFIVKYVNEMKFSSVVLYLLYIVGFVPGLILMTYMELDFIFPWYLYYLFLFIFACVVKIPVLKNKHAYMNKTSVYLLMAFFSSIILFIWIYYAHGRINFNLLNVYTLRLDAREFDMPMVLRYIFASMKIALPVFVVWSLKNKLRLMAALFSLIQLMIFFTDGSKSTFFSLLVSILGYFVLVNHVHRIKYIPIGISLLGFFSVLEYKIFETFYISAIVIRRVMFVPQSLNIRYYDFFSTHTPDYFRLSLFKYIGFESPYNSSLGALIGSYYSGNNNLNANNGLFSDAYANFGTIGILIMPLLLILLLKFIDVLSNGLTVDAILGAIITFTVSLISASFFKLFLSHGAVPLFLVFYFIPRDNLRRLKERLNLA